MGQDWKHNRACAGAHDTFTGQAEAYQRNGSNKFTQEWFHGSYAAADPNLEFPRKDNAFVAKMLLPEGWEPGARDRYRETVASLVLCHTATPSGNRRVATCKFIVLGGPGPSTIPVVPATHHFEVYESKTGRLVTSFDLKGTDRRPAASCPDSADQVSSSSVIAQTPSSDALVNKLRPLRDGKVR